MPDRRHIPLTLLIAALLLCSCGEAQAPQDEATMLLRDSLRMRLEALQLEADRRPTVALTELRTMLATADSLRLDTLRRDIHHVLGFILVQQEEHDSATVHRERSRQLAYALGERRGLVRTHILQAVGLLALSYLDSAHAALDSAEHYLDRERDSLLLAQIFTNRANIHSKRGDFPRATGNYLQAIRIIEPHNDLHTLSVLYGNLAGGFSAWGKNDQAITYFRRAIAISEADSNFAQLIMHYANLGIAFKELGKHDSALVCYHRSLELAERIGSNRNRAQNYFNIGNIHRQQGDYPRALAAYDSTLRISTRGGVRYGIAISLFSLGLVHMEMDEYGRAEGFLQRSLALARDIGLPNEEAEIHAALRDLAVGRGDFRRAFEHERQQRVLKDSVFNLAARQEIEELRLQYETEKVEFDNERLRAENEIHRLDLERRNTLIIAISLVAALAVVLIIYLYFSRRHKAEMLRLLEQKNAVIEAKSRDLAESNAMKELLLDIITHDLVNPATTISGSVSLLRSEFPDEELIDIIHHSSLRLNEILVNTRALSRVTAFDTMPKEALSLHTLLKEVLDEYSEQLRAAGLMVDLRVREGLGIRANPVIRETFKNLVDNAIKYAADGKHLVVDAVRGDGHVIITFADSGNTIPEADRESIFRRSVRLARNGEGGYGIGLAIVARIIEAHGGAVWVEANSPRGNRFHVRLPAT